MSKDFKSKRFQWLMGAKKGDPELEELYQDLRTTWDAYSLKSAILSELHTKTLPKPKEELLVAPWM